MQFANYAEFRTKVQTLIDGDDISQSDLSVDTLDLIIGMGERRIYREVRSSAMDAALSLSVTSNVATLPTDLVQLRSIYFSGNTPVEIVSYEELINGLSYGRSGDALYAAQVGDTLVFHPQVASGTLIGRYYKAFADISTALNAFFNRHPDLFLYAALSEAAPFIGDNRLQVWEQKYQNLKNWVNNEEKTRVYSSSKLATRVA